MNVKSVSDETVAAFLKLDGEIPAEQLQALRTADVVNYLNRQFRKLTIPKYETIIAKEQHGDVVIYLMGEHTQRVFHESGLLPYYVLGVGKLPNVMFSVEEWAEAKAGNDEELCDHAIAFSEISMALKDSNPLLTVQPHPVMTDLVLAGMEKAASHGKPITLDREDILSVSLGIGALAAVIAPMEVSPDELDSNPLLFFKETGLLDLPFGDLYYRLKP